MSTGLPLTIAVITWAALFGPLFAIWWHASRHGLTRRPTRRPPLPTARGGIEAGPVAIAPPTGSAKPRKVVRG